MSYDIELVDPETRLPVSVPRFAEGGTQAIGGSDEAHLNITYNYAPLFYSALDADDGIRWLYGKTGKRCAVHLRRAVDKLGTARDEDYWRPTRGNAGYALSILLEWAKQHPGAVFQGD